MSNFYRDLDLTAFPDQVDIFKQWLDVASTDGPLVKEYIEAMQAGDAVGAENVLNRIPSGTQKIIKANDLNKLTQAMLAVERFYRSDVKGYILDKQSEWEDIINQFDYKGVWSSAKTYAKNNLVSYIVFGVDHLYLAIDNVPSNASVTDTRYWRQITIEGQQGISGDGLAYRFQWEMPTSYTINDAVTYDGALWMAVKPSQGVTPSQASDSWKIIMSLATTTYPIQDNQPVNQNAGDLWFNTSKNPTNYYYLEDLNNPATSEDILSGKEAYGSNGQKIVGSSDGFAAQWNTDVSTLVWN